MPKIKTEILTDEFTYQVEFYKNLLGEDYYDYVFQDRNTDGYTDGIIFEHKKNITSFGKNKALSQALIYLSRFNRDGCPVPKYTCLVSQEEEKCYIYDNNNYFKYINDVEKYSNLKASDGISGFRAGKENKIINYSFNGKGMNELISFVEREPEFIKVDINVHNVYGWANFYYSNAKKYKQKPEKKKFFNELRKPSGTLKSYINPWKGKEVDFTFIMDMLNDPKTQRRLGAYYTPSLYVEVAKRMVDKAIKRVPKGNDYIILDRCAGGGNLEMCFSDEELKHVIVSTYELKEWIVLKDRFGKRVRYIIPPIPKEKAKYPTLNTDGFLSGANALTWDIMNNKVVKKYIDNPKCTVILFENPPYLEGSDIDFQKNKKGKEMSDWKNTPVYEVMKKELDSSVSKSALNDICNCFIWSGFRYFLRQKTDSYVLFAPIKYWKAQGLIKKKFIDGYAFNRYFFHAKAPSCVSCILWSNEDEDSFKPFELTALNIDERQNKCIEEKKIQVKKVNNLYSKFYYDRREFKDDKLDGIVSDLDGSELKKNCKIRTKKTYNKNIIGYMAVDAAGFDKNRLHSCLTRNAKYNGNGFLLRSDNFLEKLPIYAASRFVDNCNDWKHIGMTMKSADKAAQYFKDLKTGKLDDFLCKCLIWTGLSQYPHLRSLEGSDGRLYLNELCFDKNTLAKKTLNKFIKNGFVLSDFEKDLFQKYNDILKFIRAKEKGEYKEGYNPKFTYGLYQIDKEVNIDEYYKDRNGKERKRKKWGDLDLQIKQLQIKLKEYYKKELVKTLFKYEFLK